MGEQEIKMWGKGGVQPLRFRVPRCIFWHWSNVILNHFLILFFVVTNLTMVYDLWNKPMVSIATEELKYEREHLPPPPPPPPRLGYWSLQVWIWILPGISSCFGKDLPQCFKMFSCVRLQTSFAYIINFNKSKFLDYISKSFLRKGMNCGGCYHFLSTWY